MKIVVLGHTGFIGSALLSHFSSLQECEVIGYSLPEINLLDWESVSSLAAVLDEEVVLVFTSGLKRQAGENLDVFSKNMIMAQNICKLLSISPVKKIIYFSSAAVYGEDIQNLSISEKTTVCPTSYYGIAKYTTEKLLEKICLEMGIKNYIAIRPPAIYGPGDKGHDYGPVGFLQKAKGNEKIILWGDGRERREFIYIEDICQILEKLLKIEYFGHLNLASGVSYQFLDVVNILLEKFPGLKIESRPRTKSKVDNMFDISQLLAVMKGEYRFISLRDGMERMMGSYD
jgi:UDP-glucose 4-epimerase